MISNRNFIDLLSQESMWERPSSGAPAILA